MVPISIYSWYTIKPQHYKAMEAQEVQEKMRVHYRSNILDWQDYRAGKLFTYIEVMQSGSTCKPGITMATTKLTCTGKTVTGKTFLIKTCIANREHFIAVGGPSGRVSRRQSEQSKVRTRTHQGLGCCQSNDDPLTQIPQSVEAPRHTGQHTEQSAPQIYLRLSK